MISKELDRAGVPVALISAMYPVAEQVGASRVVKGLRIPHPCGDPSLPPELDVRVRQEIVTTALKALEAEVTTTKTFEPQLSTIA